MPQAVQSFLMLAAYHPLSLRGYSPTMVSSARRRRAWILLLFIWAIIAGVFGARYLSARRDAAARFDREAREQEALRQMDRLAAEAPPANVAPTEPAAAETEP